MAPDAKNMGKLLEHFARGVAAHDRETDHQAWGIGMHPFDLDRLGLDDGEELRRYARAVIPSLLRVDVPSAVADDHGHGHG